MMWRWINPDTRRYYLATLQTDLLGDWTLVTSWGAINSARGRYRSTGVTSEADGLRQVEVLDKRRRRRVYGRVEGGAEWFSG